MNEIPSLPSPGILQNDSDIENDPLTAILEAHVPGVVLNLNTVGSFSYKPPDKFFLGKITFSYKTFDGELESNNATVEIDIG